MNHDRVSVKAYVYQRFNNRLTRTLGPLEKRIITSSVPSSEADKNSATNNDNNENDNDIALSRRNMIFSSLKIPILALGFYAYGRTMYNVVTSPSFASLLNSNIAPIYPTQHEQRVSLMIQKAFDAAITSSSGIIKQSDKILRVLEVGIGTEARIIRRKLYNDAIQQLANNNNHIQKIEITGLDINIPTKDIVLQDMKRTIQQLQDQVKGMDIDVNLIQSSITDPSLIRQYADGYFDVVICCLTLCSVTDPIQSIQSMKRMVRPNGGTIAYVEHVAVGDDSTNHPFLSMEQQIFDPIQQLLVDNCHLHRPTEAYIDMVLSGDEQHDTPKYRTLYRERFYIDEMWPVSCQTCGVIQFV